MRQKRNFFNVLVMLALLMVLVMVVCDRVVDYAAKDKLYDNAIRFKLCNPQNQIAL